MNKNVIAYLILHCNFFKNGRATAEQLKEVIWAVSQEIVSLEEKNLRLFLMKSEAEIDEIQFTLDDDSQNEKINLVVDKILEQIKFLNDTI